jgi:Protein of unknown function (DUF4238)
MKSKRHHFVPQHYLRQFRIAGTNQIAVARVEPFTLIGPAAIRHQCQEDYFYEDKTVDDLMGKNETNLAPVLILVAEKESFDSTELVALRLLAATLHSRTRKAVETAKVVPKRIAHDVIKNAIERGKLSAPEGGWEEGMMDFGGVPGSLIQHNILPAWLEMQTLDCKLLKAEAAAFFLTSDHPVVLLNLLFMDAEPHRSYVGFSRSGFQLLLPISPRLCLFFYDAKVYKVGSRRHQMIAIGEADVEIVNSLQVQNAEKCLYFNEVAHGAVIANLVARYSHLRMPVQDSLRTIVSPGGTEKILHMRNPSVKLANPWSFCRLRRHVTIGPDRRRDPDWTELIRRVFEDMDRDPHGGGIFHRIEKILGISFEDHEDDS